MTPIEARVLSTTLEWAKANAEFQSLMTQWDLGLKPNRVVVNAAQARLNRAFEDYTAAREGYWRAQPVSA